MRPTTPRLVYTLAVLLAINTMNFYDRQILAGVQEKFRDEWVLSDRALGWLGTAFILLYAAVGVPLGWLADVWSRRLLLALGVGLWSLFTFGSGFAAGFWSLFALRVLVGVGEASCAPAAGSLLGDLVPPERRARTMSLFMLGLPLGLALSLFVSGMIAQRFGWQAAFFVPGVVGFVLAFLALFIADPPRGGAHAAADRQPFLAMVGRVLRLPTMWWIIASGALHNFNLSALGSFLPSLLKRYHGVSVEAAGQITGVIFGIGGLLGMFAGGWLGDRAFRRSPAGRLNVAWVSIAAAVPCLLLALAAPAGDIARCAAWLLPGYLVMYVYYGTVYATIQDIIEPALRGTAMAVYFCAMYFLGAALGPVATGWLSDHFAAAAAAGSAEVTDLHKAAGLHQAMYVVPALTVPLVAVLFAASRTVRRDLPKATP